MRINLSLHNKVLFFLLPTFFIVFAIVIGYIVSNARISTLGFVNQIAIESTEKYAAIVKTKIESDFAHQVDYKVIQSNIRELIKSFDIYGNGDAFLISNEGVIVAFSDRNKVGLKFNEEFGEIDTKYGILKNLSLRNKTSYKGKSLLSNENSFITYMPVNIKQTDTPWCFALSIPYSVVNDKIKTMLFRVILISIMGLILFTVLILYMSKSVIIPLSKASNVLMQLSNGEIDENKKLNIKTGDEIEEISDSVNSLIEGLNRTAEFAKTIGQGDLRAEYEKLGDNDDLGNALLDMRQSLVVAEDEDAKRKIEEGKQNWATQGLAKFGDILRQHNVSISDLSFNIMSNLVDYVGAIQGGLFVKNDNNEDDLYFELIGSIAFDRQKQIDSKFKIGESLVGRCAYEKLTIYIEDVPKDYVYVTSGLGESNPRSLLIVPAILNDEVFAIIELVSFTKFEKYQIEFVEKIGETIASTISNSIINQRTNKLLEQSKHQSEELAAQEEEMRQNLEELQATQEEVERLRKEEQEKSKNLIDEIEKHRAALLKILDYIPLKVFLKDSEGRMLIVNKKVLDIHGTTREELIGKNDFDFIEDYNEAKKYWDEEQEIITSGKLSNIIQKELVNNNNFVLDTTKYPFYIEYLDETGILGVQLDITERVKKDEIIKQLEDDIKELKIETK